MRETRGCGCREERWVVEREGEERRESCRWTVVDVGDEGGKVGC